MLDAVFERWACRYSSRRSLLDAWSLRLNHSTAPTPSGGIIDVLDVLTVFALLLPVARIPLSTFREIAWDIEVVINAHLETQWLRVEKGFRRVVRHIPARTMKRSIRLDALLDRRVADENGAPVGRIDEFIARHDRDRFVVGEYPVESGASIDRLQ